MRNLSILLALILTTTVYGGKEVNVDGNTRIEDHRRIGIGRYVEARGHFDNGQFTARKIEVEDDPRSDAGRMRTKDPIRN